MDIKLVGPETNEEARPWLWLALTCEPKDTTSSPTILTEKQLVSTIQELSNCTWPAWDKFNKMDTPGCPIACETVHFEPRLSFGQYPSNVHADDKSRQFRLTGSVQENRKFIRDNFLRVEIAYESMTFSVMEQTPSYDLMVLLGDIGTYCLYTLFFIRKTFIPMSTDHSNYSRVPNCSVCMWGGGY